jgi:hypothetical protein
LPCARSAAVVVSDSGCSAGFGFDTGSPRVAAFDGVAFSGLVPPAGGTPSFRAGRCTGAFVTARGCDFAFDAACGCCFAVVVALAGCCACDGRLFAAFAFGGFGAGRLTATRAVRGFPRTCDEAAAG